LIENYRLPELLPQRSFLGLVSSPREFHPEALAEPYVNVSAHTAHIIQPGKGHQDTNVRTIRVGSELPAQANVWHENGATSAEPAA